MVNEKDREVDEDLEDVETRINEMKKVSQSIGLATEGISSIASDDREEQAEAEVEQEAQTAIDQEKENSAPALIEAKMVERIAKAMHTPDRQGAYLHSSIQKGVLAAVGEMHMIENDAIVVYSRQCQFLSRMLRDSANHDADREEFEKRLEFQREKIIKNGINLQGMLSGGNQAWDLAFSAYLGERSRHGTQNIASVTSGSRNQIDHEAEASKKLFQRLKDRVSGGK